MKGVFTIDVEDWFHILDVPGAPPFERWASLPSRVERNFLKLLDMADERGVKTTCFFLGWVGERFPHLVRAASRRGHEIASHGYAHRLLYELSPREFQQDAVRAREILEFASGEAVLGYRAPGFSATEQTPWFFRELAAAGYLYDSSLFPAKRGHGGWIGARLTAGVVEAGGQNIIEFPVTVANVLGKALCFSGGGYLRLLPWSLIEHLASQVASEGRRVVFYIHPREIDPLHPRLPMSAARAFRSYVNLGSTEAKLSRILDRFDLATFRDCLATEFAGGVRADAASPSV